MIVAHPDDEILFGYSQLSVGNWHVVSMTGNNRRTRPEFEGIAFDLGFTYDIWEYDDSWNGTFIEKDVSSNLLKVLSNGFDNVLTHNENGEYGHTQHKSLSEIVSNLVSENLFVFDNNSFLSFDVLHEKIHMLSRYKTQISLNAFDWVDQNNPDNNLVSYVVKEGYKRIK
jgi:LmbE family N-acetylglucosaminyl deacetylase